MKCALKLLEKQNDFHINAVKKRFRCISFEFGTIDVYDMGLVDIEKEFMEKYPKCAEKLLFNMSKKVIELAMSNEIDATVTNAISKEAVNLAGHHYSGHTEIYADFTKNKKYTMMLAHNDLRVVHVSTHVSLREACDRVKKTEYMKLLKLQMMLAKL